MKNASTLFLPLGSESVSFLPPSGLLLSSLLPTLTLIDHPFNKVKKGKISTSVFGISAVSDQTDARLLRRA